MPSSTTTTPSKSEALARARAWRDQRCATPPTSSKKQRSTGAAATTAVATKTAKTESKATPPISQTNISAPSPASLTVATNASKQDAKERALARAREFATNLKKKKQQDDNMDVDKDDIDVDNGIPAVINVEAGESEDLSGASTTLPAEDKRELRRIATEMKNLSQQLEAALAKGST